MQKIFSWGGGKIIEIELPGFEDWLPELIEQFEKTRSTAKKSHKIGGRWENLYIDIDEVPAARNPIRMGRDFGYEILEVSSVILFEPWMRHGVRENRSNNTRLSMAFNLFPFPLPMKNL